MQLYKFSRHIMFGVRYICRCVSNSTSNNDSKKMPLKRSIKNFRHSSNAPHMQCRDVGTGAEEGRSPPPPPAYFGKSVRDHLYITCFGFF